MNSRRAQVMKEWNNLVTINNVYITNTAVFMPNEPVNNDEIENVLGMIGGRPSRAKRIVLKSNGIKQRYYVLDPKTGEAAYTNAQLTAQAIRNLYKSPSDINTIECLVTGTTLPDQIAPNHAVMVHGELDIPPCEAIATSGICLSGMTALKYAYMAVKSGEHKQAVSTGSEAASPILRSSNFEEETRIKIKELEEKPEIAFEKDFLRWMLSDGAGAFLLSPEPKDSGQINVKIEWLEVMSYANQQETCMYIGATKQANGTIKGWNEHSSTELLEHSVMSVKQDVRLLNENIVSVTLTQALKQIIEQKGLQADDIDFFLPHISSMYFYDKVQTALAEMDFDIPQERWFTNLTTKGNTGSASIYIMLDELLKSGRVKSGQKILCFIPESGRFSSSFMLLTAV